MVVITADIRQRALAATHTLSRLGAVQAAYVFGSQTEGQANEWSDIDVAAFIEGVENWDLERRAKAMALVMEEAGSNGEAHLFPATELNKPERGSFAEQVLRYGVCVLGS